VARDSAAALDGCPDLMLQACYPRDLDRVRAFEAIAAAAGRTILWPDRVAAFLRAAGAGPAVTLADAGPAAVRAAPGRFVVQPDAGDLPGLLDLPVGPASAMLHANGEPLGPFDPRWPLYADWLAQCGVPLRTIGCSGHASADDLHEMLYRIRPSAVVPIHTRSPYRLHPVGGPARLVAEYGRAYDFAGRPVPAGR
jgi:ribonuclease J